MQFASEFVGAYFLMHGKLEIFIHEEKRNKNYSPMKVLQSRNWACETLTFAQKNKIQKEDKNTNLTQYSRMGRFKSRMQIICNICQKEDEISVITRKKFQVSVDFNKTHKLQMNTYEYISAIPQIGIFHILYVLLNWSGFPILKINKNKKKLR